MGFRTFPAFPQGQRMGDGRFADLNRAEPEKARWHKTDALVGKITIISIRRHPHIFAVSPSLGNTGANVRESGSARARSPRGKSRGGVPPAFPQGISRGYARETGLPLGETGFPQGKVSRMPGEKRHLDAMLSKNRVSPSYSPGESETPGEYPG